jgi:branched-chain amino acid transport system permease protein
LARCWFTCQPAFDRPSAVPGSIGVGFTISQGQAAFQVGLGLIIALMIIPMMGMRNIFYLEVIFQISVFAALALGLNIVVGFTGCSTWATWPFMPWAHTCGLSLARSNVPAQLDPRHGPARHAFFLPQDYFYLFLFLGMAIVAAVVGILLGLPVLRVRGDYLAIVTLGFGEVIRVLANNLDKPLNLTNGPQGITPIQRPTLIPPSAGQGWNTSSAHWSERPVSEGEFYNLFFYVLALLVIVMVIHCHPRLDDSKMGRAWMAIREDELAASAMGIPVVKIQAAAFAVGLPSPGSWACCSPPAAPLSAPNRSTSCSRSACSHGHPGRALGSIPGVILGAAVVTILNLQILQGLSLWLSSLRQSDALSSR